MRVYLVVCYNMESSELLDIYSERAVAYERCITEAKKYLAEHPDYTQLALGTDVAGAHLVVNGYAKAVEWHVKEFTVIEMTLEFEPGLPKGAKAIFHLD